jgi:hypothetical protein
LPERRPEPTPPILHNARARSAPRFRRWLEPAKSRAIWSPSPADRVANASSRALTSGTVGKLASRLRLASVSSSAPLAARRVRRRSDYVKSGLAAARGGRQTLGAMWDSVPRTRGFVLLLIARSVGLGKNTGHGHREGRRLPNGAAYRAPTRCRASIRGIMAIGSACLAFEAVRP